MKQNVRRLTIFLLLTSLFLTSCGGILYTPPSAAQYCDIDPALLEPQIEGKTVIDLWVAGERHYCWRAYAPVVVAHQRPDLSLAVRVSNLEINTDPLTEQLLDLSARGAAPDIAYATHRHAVELGEAGYLHPLDECIQRPEFRHIPQKFWHSFSTDKRTWGIPIENEFVLLFYNKSLLQKLGWTQQQIDALPNRILDGSYTLQDMVATAKEAVEANVVEPGRAFVPARGQYNTVISIYLHLGGMVHNDERSHFLIDKDALEQTYSYLSTLHRNQLFDRQLARRKLTDWGTKLVIRDAATHNRFLFWHATNSEMQNMAVVYEEGSSESDALSKHIGVSLLPAPANAQSGSAFLVTSGQYMIFADHATGRNNQVAACDLLAAIHASGLLKEHAEKGGYITFSEDGLYLPSWFPTGLPMESINFRAPHIAGIQTYRDILAEISFLIASDDLSASQAVDVTVERMRNTFGSRLIVE